MGKLIGNTWRVVGLGISGLLLLSTFFLCIGVQNTRAAGSDIIYANALLGHVPYGSGDLQWNASTNDLVVTIHLNGLAPNSRHPAHIHLGSCTSNGPILLGLNDVVADSAGNAVMVTILHNILYGIPDKKWSINVHNGPGLSTAAQFTPLACADITNPHHLSSIHTFLGSTNAPNQAAYGSAHLTLNKGNLAIILDVHGLEPGSTHAAHIHNGSCENQLPGNVAYTLPFVKGDKQGNAHLSILIPHVHSIPAHSWYINIHRGVTLTTQTGFDPILCGNVVLS
jgi:CHRD domain